MFSYFCCDIKFLASKMTSKSHTGDIALIRKAIPLDAARWGKNELISPLNNYSVSFNLNESLNAAQKTTVLAGQILIDYMIFDGRAEKCVGNGNRSVSCYFAFCNIFGFVCPLCLTIPISLYYCVCCLCCYPGCGGHPPPNRSGGGGGDGDGGGDGGGGDGGGGGD